MLTAVGAGRATLQFSRFFQHDSPPKLQTSLAAAARTVLAVSPDESTVLSISSVVEDTIEVNRCLSYIDVIMQKGGGVFIIAMLLLSLVGIYNQLNRDKTKWYGTMICNRCGYRWQSRRNTPPARCANCRSKNIRVERG